MQSPLVHLVTVLLTYGIIDETLDVIGIADLLCGIAERILDLSLMHLVLKVERPVKLADGLLDVLFRVLLAGLDDNELVITQTAADA